MYLLIFSLLGVTVHYVIDQAMISNCDVEKMLGGDTKYNPLDSTWTSMIINH
jgi:hypothetical protein